MQKNTYKKIVLVGLIVVVTFISGYTAGNWFNQKKISNLEEIVNTNPIRENQTENLPLSPISKSSQKAIPAVVHIYTDSSYNNENQSRIKLRSNSREKTLGSGILVSPDGYIITNNHVISSRENLNIELFDKRKFIAEIIGRDYKTDLAVLKIKSYNLPYILFADSDLAQIGDIVLAVGNPLGIGESVTMGIVSATGRSNVGITDYENFIQTDAAINPGNSGGALVNLEGKLIGINTAIVTRSGGYEGISYAIPSNMAKSVFMQIIKNGKVERGWLGMAVQQQEIDNKNTMPNNKQYGVVIVDIMPDSPAMIAGLNKGDIIAEVNDTVIKSQEQIKNLIAQNSIGKELILTIFRGGQMREMSIKISKIPDKINISKYKNYYFPAK